MKFSYNWIQDHIENKLPPTSEIDDILSRKSLEIEEIDGDVLDIKVLPHRQHDCFSHRGIARELCTLFSFKEKIIQIPEIISNDDSFVDVVVEDTNRCKRYVAVKIENIKVAPSEDWLKNKLISIGQRSISNVVDITNFVMNDIGQPMHAFDAKKVVGKISVRLAIKGEKMITLDDKDLTMNGTETVIADDEGILALAGVKGGKKALVDENTTSIIFESANFNGTITRKTSDLHNIKTDSSKRYEANITSEYTYEAIKEAVALLLEINKDAKVSKVTDIYNKKEKNYKVGVSLFEINNLLGSLYQDDEVENVFKYSKFNFEKVIPSEKIRELINSTLDKPYKLGASVLYDGGEMFDCSSLVSFIYKEIGFSVPRISVDQFVYAKKINANDLQIGDLIFANSNDGKIYFESVEYIPFTKVSEGVDHVGIYLGNDEVVHATRVFGKVVKESLESFSKERKIIGYGRVANNLDEPRYVVIVPLERLDIRIKEDLIEEIGRVMGYDNLPSVLPVLNRKGLPHKRLYYETKIKNILIQNGFSEIYTYTFGNKGDVSIVKGLATDKEKLRNNLGEGVLSALKMNLNNSPVMGIDTVRVFEFGNVFTENKEWRNFSIGVDDGKKKSSFTEEVDLILSQIKRELKLETGDLEIETVSNKPYVIEIDFDKLIEGLSDPLSYESINKISEVISYKTVSMYPFIVRDVACWTPFSTSWEDVYDVIKQVKNSLIIRIDCFDSFTKEIDGVKKISYAFRVVLQSNDKTLTDEEANEVAGQIYNLLKEKGFEIR